MRQRLHVVFGVWTGEADAGQLSPRNTIDMVACRRGMLPECQVHELIFLEDLKRNLSHMRQHHYPRRCRIQHHLLFRLLRHLLVHSSPNS